MQHNIQNIHKIHKSSKLFFKGQLFFSCLTGPLLVGVYFRLDKERIYILTIQTCHFLGFRFSKLIWRGFKKVFPVMRHKSIWFALAVLRIIGKSSYLLVIIQGVSAYTLRLSEGIQIN